MLYFANYWMLNIFQMDSKYDINYINLHIIDIFPFFLILLQLLYFYINVYI